MGVREVTEAIYQQHVAALVACEPFRAVEEGTAGAADFDRFIANVIRTHLASPRYLAFLYSVAPPAAAPRLLHNLLEELGREEADGTSHPDLLRALAHGAGLGGRLPELARDADDRIRDMAASRLLYGTLKEAGLSALAEVNAFEYMLSRVASRIARALARHRGLDDDALRWFTHHAEVDLAHAEQGFLSMDDFVAHYGFTDDDATTIIEMTMRENAFIRRYFGEVAQGRAAGMLR
jgi:hypothetical protein